MSIYQGITTVTRIPKPKKVEVVQKKQRSTETVGDDGTLDSDFLSKPRRPTTSLVKPHFIAYTHIPQSRWDAIFNDRSQ